jgi:hypothetical protein
MSLKLPQLNDVRPSAEEKAPWAEADCGELSLKLSRLKAIRPSAKEKASSAEAGNGTFLINCPASDVTPP